MVHISGPNSASENNQQRPLHAQYIDGLVHDSSNSIADILELTQFSTKLSMYPLK